MLRQRPVSPLPQEERGALLDPVKSCVSLSSPETRNLTPISRCNTDSTADTGTSKYIPVSLSGRGRQDGVQTMASQTRSVFPCGLATDCQGYDTRNCALNDPKHGSGYVHDILFTSLCLGTGISRDFDSKAACKMCFTSLCLCIRQDAG